MIKSICKNTDLLAIKCTKCFFTDLEILNNRQIIADMIDTAESFQGECEGLAANQINEYKRIIIVRLDGEYVPMVNPKYTPVRSAGIKQFKEGCLSYPDRTHRVQIRRFKKINLTYQLVTGLLCNIKLSSTASKIDSVIAQHEIDHLNGILI